MSPEAQRIAIAEACGWRFEHRHGKGTAFAAIVIVFKDEKRHGSHWPDSKQLSLDLTKIGIPDYLTDLNAMHEAERALNQQQQRDYVGRLHYDSEKKSRRHTMDHLGVDFDVAHATAAERAEAFLRARNEWREAP